ncbi:MAG: helix-turn-helix domain-containing protein [Spirochaetes bacterium]|nr:helix-turn-helix domain-containing protein [Spirochaetota bacterium]
METVGQILGSTREKKGLSLKEISLNTNVGLKYLMALEHDNYEVFPSDTHAIGFIRNYSKYLDLDPDQIIDIYKRALIQETPAPLEALTAPTRTRINPMTIVVALLTIFVSFFLIVLIAHKGNKNTDLDNILTNDKDQTTKNKQVDENNLTGKEITKYFSNGDKYVFEYAGKKKALVFRISSNKAAINLMGTDYLIKAKQKLKWDFNGDSYSDLKVTVMDIKDNKVNASISRVPERIVKKDETTKDNKTSSTVLKGKRILIAQNRVDIHLTIKAKGASVVNIIKDSNEKKSYFLKDKDTVSVLAKNTILITASNPFNLSININNVQLEITTKNAIAGFLFKWRKDPTDGNYHLEWELIR